MNGSTMPGVTLQFGKLLAKGMNLMISPLNIQDKSADRTFALIYKLQIYNKRRLHFDNIQKRELRPACGI